ncbi:cupin domain-containing protein [Emcibacter sp.]|uniref:cupin domain-containing protein n=1 Tax=Emcibacter sp. TaxID=1979954 RepID=UPI002AA63AC4|nr:cupin domain-containing protein [Emcibacter sp.]
MANKQKDYDWGRMDWLLDGEEAEGPGFSVAKMIMEAGRVGEKHFHDNCQEFLLVEQGRVILEIDGRQRELHGGESFLIPAGVTHRVINNCCDVAVLTLVYSTHDRHYTSVG